MKTQIIQGDITRLKVDAIVNAANSTLLGGAGVDGAIHSTAGPMLLSECRSLRWCSPGDAKMTGGYELPAKHVIHTVGPIWHGGNDGEEQTLISCYRAAMTVALYNGLKSIAFPLISAGAYGYPKDKAIEVALRTLKEFENEDIEIFLILFDAYTYELANEIAKTI